VAPFPNFTTMKPQYFLAVLILASGIWMAGCGLGESEPGPAPPVDQEIAAATYRPSIFRAESTLDTITTSSSAAADTITIGTFLGPVEFEAVVYANNISGTSNLDAILEYTPTLSGTGNWATLSSVTISADTSFVVSTDIISGRLRWRMNAPSSTQSTEYNLEAVTVNAIPQM
jgi:hypothetical protein